MECRTPDIIGVPIVDDKLTCKLCLAEWRELTTCRGSQVTRALFQSYRSITTYLVGSCVTEPRLCGSLECVAKSG